MFLKQAEREEIKLKKRGGKRKGNLRGSEIKGDPKTLSHFSLLSISKYNVIFTP